MTADPHAGTGAFIAFEGLDGVGKSTLVAAVASALGAVSLAMPGVPRPVAHAVFTSLGHDATSRCLFHAACARALGQQARAITASGRHVLVDRYWLSSVAYARARAVSLDLAAVERAIPAPDLTLLLTVDEDERCRRLEARGATAVDRETMHGAFRDTALAELMRADRGTAFEPPVVVDLSRQTPGDALSNVLDALRRHGVLPTPKEHGR
jgi:dTMP kinase